MFDHFVTKQAKLRQSDHKQAEEDSVTNVV